jgi:hypothetical protein
MLCILPELALLLTAFQEPNSWIVLRMNLGGFTFEPPE